MEKEKKKKKICWGQWASVLIYGLIGGVCGVLMADTLAQLPAQEGLFGGWLLPFALLVLLMYGVMLLQIILHEGGHLLFGLLSGYRFRSFRIMNLMLLKTEEGLRFCRLSLAGTGGQCLLDPADLVDGEMPVFLYNLGGSLLNIIVSGLALLPCLLLPLAPLIRLFLLLFSIIGFGFALMNGVPMRMGTVDNDGYNAISLGRDPAALRAFWIQMKVNQQQSLGLRLGEMPEAWFQLPDEAGMQNSLIATLAVLACNRLMDQHRFAEADALMEDVLAQKSGVIGLQRGLLLCDRICCLLLRGEDVSPLLDKVQRRFMHSMRNYPSVLRCQYALALLAEGDVAKAEKIKSRFVQVSKSYPYASEIEGERELMELLAAAREKI